MSDLVLTLQVSNEEAMVELGKKLGVCLEGSVVIFLHGGLGAGKTTFSRGVLQAFGHLGAVKSPTYTLVEPYAIKGNTLYHFDLYRLADPEELEYIGIRDYFRDKSICLVEWPERGETVLPEPDLHVDIQLDLPGRRVCLNPVSETGKTVLRRFQQMETVVDSTE